MISSQEERRLGILKVSNVLFEQKVSSLETVAFRCLIPFPLTMRGSCQRDYLEQSLYADIKKKKYFLIPTPSISVEE